MMIETAMSGMLWEEEGEERGIPPFERSDAPQRPDMAAAPCC